MTICGVEIPAEIIVTDETEHQRWRLVRQDADDPKRGCLLPHTASREQVALALLYLSDVELRP